MREWFEFWSLRFTWVLELGFWDFLADLRLSLAAATIFIRYDEGTAQAQGLADDRHRPFDDPVHLLLRQDAGYWEGTRRSRPNLRPPA